VAKLEGCSCRGDRGTEFRSGAMVVSRLQRVCGRVLIGGSRYSIPSVVLIDVEL
jgi:hypothetical protein